MVHVAASCIPNLGISLKYIVPSQSCDVISFSLPDRTQTQNPSCCFAVVKCSFNQVYILYFKIKTITNYSLTQIPNNTIPIDTSFYLTFISQPTPPPHSTYPPPQHLSQMSFPYAGLTYSILLPCCSLLVSDNTCL